jgi:prepilin-type N-terminal cleavage/methylation domain-containing protein
MRKGFTLIEMMVAISIFALIIVFLYQSYASLNASNQKLQQTTKALEHFGKIKRTIFLDFALALNDKVTVIHQDREHDVVFLATSNSVHHRFHPNVAYIVKEGALYRMESLKPFVTYPLESDRIGDVDFLAKVNRFRVYKALKKDTNNTKTLFLVDVVFEDAKRILYKIPALNQN